MSRRIITKADVNDALDAGEKEIRLGPSDIVTSLAADYAERRGLELSRAGETAASTAGTGAGKPDPQAVRQAVIAALGHEPEQLDSVIAKVTKS